MPSFCHFWQMTPEAFDRLPLRRFERMTEYMKQHAQKQAKQ